MMWTNRPSIQKAQSRALAKAPAFCPNPNCRWHNPSDVPKHSPFHRHGISRIARFPYLNQRYRCSRCRRTFSASYFSLLYRDRHDDFYEELFELHNLGASLASIARLFGVHEDSIRRRKHKLARWALLELAHDVNSLRLEESVAYDGLENFAYSQYEPNNLNHAVGRESLFIYDFNLAPLNRKGRMSPRQKRKKAALEAMHGGFPQLAIRETSKRVFARIWEKSGNKLVLHTDNHFAYRQALHELPGSERLVHWITPAKVARNYRNRLFAINHTDMLSRHHLAAFKRETIAFSKNSIAMLESFLLFAVHKNYMRPCFWKAHLRQPKANEESPAMRLRLRPRILSFRELFRAKRTVRQVLLHEDWLLLFRRVDPFARRPVRQYQGI